jgi:uncharacterized coiled-coil protein SlyX
VVIPQHDTAAVLAAEDRSAAWFERMDPQDFHILTTGGVLQLAAVVVAVAEVSAAYRRLLGKRPVSQVLHEWWPPWRRPRDQDIRRGIVDTIEAADELDAAGTVTSWPPPSDIEGRLRHLEDVVDDHEQRLRMTEDAVSASDAAWAELSEDVASLRTELDDAERRLRRLINAVEAGNVPARVFIAVAWFLGVAYATWHEWIADNLYWLAMLVAGFAFGYHIGWWLVYRRRAAA